MGRRVIPCINCGSEVQRPLLSVYGNRGAAFIEREHRVVVCEQCGLGFLNPQHEETDYARYYASLNYAPICISGAEMLHRSAYRKVQAAFLLDTLARFWPSRTLSHLTALDVGCGPGILLALMRAQLPKAEGLELGKQAVDFAEREYGLKIHRGSIFEHDIDSEAFDVVVSTAAIEHFTNPLHAIERMRDLLHPGGLLYINTQDTLGMVLKNGADSWFKFVHTYYYTEQTLGSLIELAGFEIVRSWTMPPILKASIISPHNFCSGELNIIAVKKDSHGSKSWRGESRDRVHAAYSNAYARDRLHASVGRIMGQRFLGYPLRLWNRWHKPPDLFDEYFDADGNVDPSFFE